MTVTEKERQKIISDYTANISAKRREAIKKRWAGKTRQERQEFAAILLYARQLKLYGKERADAVILEKFGPERGKMLLAKRQFKRQWINNLPV